MSEISKPQEAYSQPAYDAALIHGYWLSNDAGQFNVDGFRGSLRTRLVTRAAVDLYEAEGPFKLVFTGGKLKGPSYPATSALFAEEAIHKYGIPSEDVITAENGFDTETESEAFRDIATENGWQNMALISFEQHSPSVRRFAPRITEDKQDAVVEHRTVEEILQSYDHPHVSMLAQRLKRSIKYRIGFNAYEAAKAVIMSVPGGKEWLYGKNRTLRAETNDSMFNDTVTSAIDVFNS